MPLNAHGFIGLQPPQSTATRKSNLLATLKDSGLIDKEMFGLSINIAKDAKSYLRLGGYNTDHM